MTENKSLGEMIPIEQARVREVLAVYQSIPQGKFGALMIEVSLKEMDEAVISGDLARMMFAYEELKGIE